MKIDFHIHTITRKMLDVPWYGGLFEKYNPGLFTENGKFPLTPERVLQEMDNAGVDYSLILPNESVGIGIDIPSDFALEFCQGHDRLLPYVNINPHTTRDPVKEFERFVNAGARALKLYPTYQWFYPNDPILYKLYAAVEERGIPVMFHTGSSIFPTARIKYGDPIFLDDVAVDFPRLNIVMAHSGRGPWYEHAVSLARTRRNVFLEISGIPPHRLLEYLPAVAHLSDKTIFGSDWPTVPPIKKIVDGISSLKLPEGALEKIFWGNAARLLKLEKPAGDRKERNVVSGGGSD